MILRESRVTVSTRSLRALHADGLSCREIGRRVGLHPSTVHRRLARRGVVRPKRVLDRFSDEQKERAVSLYRVMGLAGVSRFLNLRCKNATARLLRSLGVTIRANPYERRK